MREYLTLHRSIFPRYLTIESGRIYVIFFSVCNHWPGLDWICCLTEWIWLRYHFCIYFSIPWWNKSSPYMFSDSSYWSVYAVLKYQRTLCGMLSISICTWFLPFSIILQYVMRIDRLVHIKCLSLTQPLLLLVIWLITPLRTHLQVVNTHHARLAVRPIMDEGEWIVLANKYKILLKKKKKKEN